MLINHRLKKVAIKYKMNSEELYLFHQTPEILAKKLLTFVPFENNDSVFEPFAGEKAFFNNFPTNTTKYSTEIKNGKCFTSFTDKVEWIVTNPPYSLVLNGKKIRSSFWYLLKHFCNQSNKGIAMLGNYNCFNSLSPKRMKELNENGWYLNNIVICNVKKWANRYFFLIFSRVNTNDCVKYVEGVH